MNKRYWHHHFRNIRKLKLSFLVMCTLLSLVVYVFAARHNNVTMLKLKQAVFVADESGGNTEEALKNLRQYVFAHMNTDLTPGDFAVKPPIQLKYTYQRLLTEEKKRVSDSKSQIYNEGQTECEKRFPGGLFGSGRIPCVEEYVASRGVVEKPIPKELYQFDFVSPRWSPDVAGWSLVAVGVFGIVAILRLGFWLFYHYGVKKNI